MLAGSAGVPVAGNRNRVKSEWGKRVRGGLVLEKRKTNATKQ